MLLIETDSRRNPLTAAPRGTAVVCEFCAAARISPSVPSVDHNQFSKTTMEAESHPEHGPPDAAVKVIGGSSSSPNY
jgi:hypothetical protein